MERRQAVSNWLETVVRDQLLEDLKHDTSAPHSVFSLLTGHSILEACKKAHSSGKSQIATNKLVLKSCLSKNFKY